MYRIKIIGPRMEAGGSPKGTEKTSERSDEHPPSLGPGGKK